MGAPWRMPTGAEFEELINNCSHLWTTINGVNGYVLTSNINGNSIFIPAAGDYSNNSLANRNIGGFYWSSTYANATSCHFLEFRSGSIRPNDTSYRRLGFCIRPVQTGTPNRSIVPPIPEDEPKDEEPKDEEPQTMEEPKDDNMR